MASVSSLDQDMRKLRLDRYTPQAANEMRDWIESTLGEALPTGDILDVLKDGSALCKLANLALPPPGIKYKPSSMPFVQRENISHFLRACEMPPLNMPSHDRFLTVDLYDGKDPAQVLQCIQAFSRAANAVDPGRFPRVIGPRGQRPPSPVKKPADWAGRQGVSHVRGPSVDDRGDALLRSPPLARALSPALTGGSNASKGSPSQPAVSAWRDKKDEASTLPAWNIHQYGYMGGANQGTQGIAFGARRQITSASPSVPSLAEKEKIRKEREEQERHQREESERRQEQLEAEERQSKEEEERRWEDETRRAREAERAEVERQKRKWEEEERRWREEEEQRKREEEKLKPSGNILRGQYLSDYQSQSPGGSKSPRSPREAPSAEQSEQDRIRELERQLEEARERERLYLSQREDREAGRNGAKTPVRPLTPQPAQVADALEDESLVSDVSILSEPDGGILSSPRAPSEPEVPTTPRPLPTPKSNPMDKPPAYTAPPAYRPSSSGTSGLSHSPTRSRPSPFSRPSPSVRNPATSTTSTGARPLPSPSPFTSARPAQPPRTERFLSSNPAPVAQAATTHVPAEAAGNSTAEQDAEDRRRKERQANTKAGGWASKSLLEREMERERERQKEWEEQQVARGGGRVMGPRAMGGR